MTSFLLAAAVLALLAIAGVVTPLLSRRTATPRTPLAALLATVVVVGSSAWLYVASSNWDWAAGPAAPASELTQLARRARAAPEDRSAWLRLGQAYVQAGQLPLARRAFEHANALAAGRDPEALAGLAEALLLAGEESGVAAAAGLLEQALRLDPRSAKALFYGGLVAMNQGRLEVARERFATMLTLDPPQEVRTALTGQIATLERMLHPPVDAATLIDLQIDVADALRARVPAQGVLFVFVRNPAGGPPLAVRRLAAALPVRVQLSALDGMAGPGAFASGQQLQVVARVSASGEASAASGELYGELRYRAGRDGPRPLRIDQITP